MKRILISNKFYYNRGGDCVASLSLEKLLKEKGHPVAFFSMKYPLNFTSEWEKFFVPSIDFSGSIKEKIKATNRIFYSQTVKKYFLRLIDEFKPDIVHLNNIHSYISPYIGEIAHKKGIKVVWSLHDYKLVCPTYLCLHNGKTCELCIKKGPSNVLRNRCMKNSFTASILAYLEAITWNKKKLAQNTDKFIAPSNFMKEKMILGGFPSNKIQVLPHFTNRIFTPVSSAKQNYYCFVGRLSEEKGIKTLINVAQQLPYKLTVIGTGPLKDSFNLNNKTNIEFVGYKEWEEIQSIIKHAKFLVSPSECFEVFGLSNIEAQCLGTPVLGAKIGGIPEVIDEYQNGLLFKSGDADDLKEKIELMFHTPFDYTEISQKAREKYSAENYYKELIKIYNE